MDTIAAVPVSSPSTPTLGAWLQVNAHQLAQAWRRAAFVDSARRPTSLLDGVVETLVFEVGRGLDHLDEPSGAAWTRAAGVVRHAAQRGRPALAAEFRRLALCVDREARAAGASELQRMRLRLHFVAAHAQAATELDSGAGRPGHVVVEVFEMPPRLPARRRHAA
jgi:hypothetical protein